MGVMLESTPEMGGYGVEVRRSTFYLAGPITVYENPGFDSVAEFDIAEIPKIRAALDLVEKHAKGRRAAGG